MSSGSTAGAAVVPLHLEREPCCPAYTTSGGGTAGYRLFQAAVVPLVVPLEVPADKICSQNTPAVPCGTCLVLPLDSFVIYEGSQRYYRQYSGSTARPGSFGTYAKSSSSMCLQVLSRKVFQLERVKIVIIELKWNAQGKGMILIEFLLYRSQGVSGRPGYRIDTVLSRGALK